MRRFIVLFGVIALLFDFYVYQGIKRISADWRSATLRKAVRRGYWIFFIAFNICFTVVVFQRFSTGENNDFMKWIMNLFLIFFVTKLVFILVLFGEDLVRAGVALIRLIKQTFSETESDKKLMPGRRKFVSQSALILASIPFASFLYGMVKGKYQYTVHRSTLFFEDLPAAFDGFKITQLSDIHAGSFDDPEAVQRGIDLAKAQKGDLFVFTGDLVNDYATEVVPYINHFKQLKAPFGQFSVLGNHDYGMYAKWPTEKEKEQNLRDLKQHHADMGYKLLLDEAVTIEKDGEKLSLIGVENWGKGFIQIGNLDKALANISKDAFKVLLSHDPSHWEEVVKHHEKHVHLTLSGHTHGMQFGIETPVFKWSPAQFRYKTWAGLAAEAGKMLYVNRGFGFIGFSGRVGIWPEITVLELRKGKAPA
ncbi:metallophosphoesterase [Adhaeribacter sp. BT258]|uniref:Metallophosphoesterase n=1 Tax=Adhaeribacter terrigena TaxID=2793070 RepID=A0ABS1C034_9BACT|nr:metallophosphoesterase [Adhaeribacter terrigena]MBK0402752.1 metallophosphoesterase [Adhaeribacter terrigena]